MKQQTPSITIRQTSNSEFIAYLITHFTYGSLSETQHDKLDAWVDAKDKNMKLFEDLTDERVMQQIVDWLVDADLPGILNRLKNKLGMPVN
jgi:hypothetical protein